MSLLYTLASVIFVSSLYYYLHDRMVSGFGRLVLGVILLYLLGIMNSILIIYGFLRTSSGIFVILGGLVLIFIYMVIIVALYLFSFRGYKFRGSYGREIPENIKPWQVNARYYKHPGTGDYRASVATLIDWYCKGYAKLDGDNLILPETPRDDFDWYERLLHRTLLKLFGTNIISLSSLKERFNSLKASRDFKSQLMDCLNPKDKDFVRVHVSDLKMLGVAFVILSLPLYLFVPVFVNVLIYAILFMLKYPFIRIDKSAISLSEKWHDFANHVSKSGLPLNNCNMGLPYAVALGYYKAEELGYPFFVMYLVHKLFIEGVHVESVNYPELLASS